MANHAKRRPVPKGIWIGSAVTAAVAILVTVGILLVNNGVLDPFMAAFELMSWIRYLMMAMMSSRVSVRIALKTELRPQIRCNISVRR